MAAIMRPAGDARGPGCTERCRRVQALLPGVFGHSSLLLHDPDAHEQYGLTLAVGHADPAALVVTGRLVVDLGRLEASVDGRVLRCSATEWRLLRLLARRCGMTVESDALITEVWRLPPQERSMHQPNLHLLRVVVARLRGRLGPAASLIRTVVGLGYRLEMAEPGTTMHVQDWPAPLETWARDWDRCRACGRSDRAHEARGYCYCCYGRWRSTVRRARAVPRGIPRQEGSHEGRVPAARETFMGTQEETR